MAGALKGIRIIDLTSMISGPSATMILGDQDAEIIKIEKHHENKGHNTYGNGYNCNYQNFVDVSA